MIANNKILGIIFSKSPYGSHNGEEGIELLIHLSSFFKKIYVFFIGDGIFQIFRGQNPKLILFKKYTNLFKMFKFLHIKKCFFLKDSFQRRGFITKKISLNITIKSKKFFFPIIFLNAVNFQKKLSICTYVLNF